MFAFSPRALGALGSIYIFYLALAELSLPTHVTWHVTLGGRWTFSQNFRSLAHTVWEGRCLEDLEEKDDHMSQLGKPSGEKICFCLDFSQTAWIPRPPPPLPLYFWMPSRNFFKPYFIWIKVPQSVWILGILPHFPWKIYKPKQKLDGVSPVDNRPSN